MLTVRDEKITQAENVLHLKSEEMLELNEQAAEEKLKQVLEANTGLSTQEEWMKLIAYTVEASHTGLASAVK